MGDPLSGHRERVIRVLVPSGDVLNVREFTVGHLDGTLGEIVLSVVPKRRCDQMLRYLDREVGPGTQEFPEFFALPATAHESHAKTVLSCVSQLSDCDCDASALLIWPFADIDRIAADPDVALLRKAPQAVERLTVRLDHADGLVSREDRPSTSQF